MGVIDKNLLPCQPSSWEVQETGVLRGDMGPRSIPGTPLLSDSEDGDNSSIISFKMSERPTMRSPQHRAKRKARRIRNQMVLETLVEDCEEDGGLVPIYETVFSQIDKSPRNSQMWHCFIMSKESDQQDFLHFLATGTTPKKQNREKLLVQLSTEDRYQQIQKNPRSALKDKNVPLDVLCSLEMSIMKEFSKNPKTVYLSPAMTKQHRRILHAICQYLLLNTTAIDVDRSRRVKAWNRFQDFHAPSQSLHDLIQKQLHKKNFI